MFPPEPACDSTTASPPPAPVLTVVALGASAGGLEALQDFFRGMPADARFAFVVITHLPPQHESRMAEVLRRASAMPVSEAEDHEAIAPGRVYVIPPNRLMSIKDRVLLLETVVPRPTVPHPIDHFMRALAEDQQERSVGIVLSGADHDGTGGLKEIRAAGGMTMVQDPSTAQFPGMPRSAIACGVPDAILPAGKMGRALIDYVAHAPTTAVPETNAPVPGSTEDGDLTASLDAMLRIVQERSGQDFRCYRPAMLLRRIRRRMGLRSASDVFAYVALLQASDEEVQALVKDFRIGVTEFFRQPEAWQALEEQVVPQLVEARAASGGVRVWTPGCATGEESYSIAMLLLEQLGERSGSAAVNVFATDVDPEALAVGRAGSYPESIVDAVGPRRLTRFFERSGESFAVRKALRETVLFALQDLARDPPFSKLDLIVCRNVLIYFEPVEQARILETFHFALNPDGVLFLGKSESLGAQSELFEPVSRTHRIFRRVGATARLPRVFEGRWRGPGAFLTASGRRASALEPGLAERLRVQLDGRPVTAAVLVNRDYRALFFQGETARYLQPAGEPAWDLLSLLRDGLRGRVRAGLQEAITGVRPVEIKAHLKRERDHVPVRVRIEPLADFSRTGLLAVSFDEQEEAAVTPPEAGPAAAAFLEEELQHLRSDLANAERHSESAEADLRVANEEAMSLNEELQSSNEELQTSKEELQSMNEELASVNSELEDKVAELERVLGDLRNLLDNTRVALLVLDRDLCIRRFTPEATRLFRLIATDEGRPVRDIAACVSDPALLADAIHALEGRAEPDREVATADGAWFLRRILPYRDRERHVTGVVVTYTEITELRKAAQDARRLAAVLHDSNDAVIVHDFDGRIRSWNRGAEAAYGYSEAAALAMNVAALTPRGAPASAADLTSIVRETGSAGPNVARRLTRDGRVLDVSVTLSALRDDAGEAYAVVATERDVTEKLRLESEIRFRAMADHIPTLLRIDDADGRAEFLNRAWLAFTGESTTDALLANGWLRCVHPDDVPDYLKGVGAARVQQRRFEGDLRLRRADGVYRWMRTTAVPRTDDTGRAAGYVSVSVDIEARKRAEQAMAQESQRKDEFLAMLAHELRNPLAPIANASRVIEHIRPTDPKIAWATGLIARQTQQLARLVDDLMDIARVTSGKVTLTRELIEVPVLVQRARDLTQPSIDKREQRLVIKLPPEALYLDGDRVRLTQVLANLLDNASKYSERGSEIRLEALAADEDVIFRVSDDGLGISADMLPRVFDLFAQEDKTLDRAQGGLGIGLTLVDRLVRAHGGTVEVRSEGLGRGSEFIVRLPRFRVAQPSPTAPRAVVQAGNREVKRVLVVDDNVDSADSTAMLLDQAGYQTRTAYDGEGALAAVPQFHPDVIVLDIGLPGMDGYELARRLRGRGETADTLLIALTGYGRPEDAERAKGAGLDHHLVKPVSWEQLADLVARHLPRPGAGSVTGSG
jgi:two-component system CheB/CheR fusion protein